MIRRVVLIGMLTLLGACHHDSLTNRSVAPRDPSTNHVVAEPSALVLFGGGLMLMGFALGRRKVVKETSVKEQG